MALEIKKEFKKDLGFNRSRKTDLSTMVYGKVPPHSNELEEVVLGAMLLEREKLSDVLEIISTPECFYNESNQKIFAGIRRLAERGQAVDLLTITEELRKTNELEIVGGAYYLTRLTMSVVTSAHVETHARLLIEKFIQRELIRISGEVISDAYEDSTDVFDLLDKAESNLYEITDQHLRKNYKSLQEVLVKTMDEIEKNRDKADDLTGVPSGYVPLDKITNGWQKSDLIILAARPSVGKTAFALNLALNAALNPGNPMPVAIFSLEMGAGQLVRRLLSAVTDVSMEAITRGKMEEHEFIQLSQRMTALSKAPIFIDDQAALNIFELRAKARRLKQRNNIQMIVIDYLQLMHANTDKNGSREQEISKISRELKGLAKELDLPIIALSQLNRSVENRGKESKVPQLSDLRESGAIEQDADMVMFLYRPEYYKIENDEMGQSIEGEVQIHIAKHRNGSIGEVKVKFIKEYQKFVDVEDAFGFMSGKDNPTKGIRRDNSDFGGSKLYIPDNYQTRPSKMNDYRFDEDESIPPPPSKPTKDDNEEVPF